jgi:hypothetical protein
MRTILTSLSLLILALAPACKSCQCSPGHDPQSVVENHAKTNADVTRLTVHCTPDGGSGPVACASTSAEKKGKPSDPEDLKAMQTGETVVLDEAGAVDVTVPIFAKDGKFAGACGVTLKNAGMTREQTVARATSVARAVEKDLAGCCEACCKK